MVVFCTDRKDGDASKNNTRWVFEAKDNSGNVVFPASYVKISNKPSFDSGSIFITHFLKLPKVSFNEFSNSLKYSKEKCVSSLKLIDNNGNILEQFKIVGSMLNSPRDFDVAVSYDNPEEMIASWNFEYDDVLEN